MSDRLNRPLKSSRPSRKRALSGRLRWPIIALIILAGVLVFAWIDGGEEPLRPIVQPVVTSASDHDGNSGETE